MAVILWLFMMIAGFMVLKFAIKLMSTGGKLVDKWINSLGDRVDKKIKEGKHKNDDWDEDE